jgi:hypothetical protein
MTGTEADIPTNEIIRVFPRRTSYTPDDDMVFIGRPPLMRPEAKEVHISCTFTWDKPVVEDLAEDWSNYYSNVTLGGPAYDDEGEFFTPGMYVKKGVVVTSRGCPNKCWYCFVPKREGALRLLPVVDGYDIIDNNLLACPEYHITKVLDMLERQGRACRFGGGLEARLLTEEFVWRLSKIGLQQAFFAYDRPGDVEACRQAFAMMREAGFSRQKICCYVLVGYRGDTQAEALKRLEWVKTQGATPFAMYYQTKGAVFVKQWIRPAAIWGQHPSVKEAHNGQMALKTLFESEVKE